ncbi:phosphotriesterase [Emticicia sp. BO119]|uniref:phosphotriesterase family protein n=1 Tax=Emticicia sp. BO119 TaxID=2757768 RepID=UPI0015F073BF|nr:phosphotriesterase [Emticicia sp. BO119]MBA4850825.1 phosphotriesterase [Emticicia sp. BO119]
MQISRRSFLLISLGSWAFTMKKPQVMTINGWINVSEMGKTLIHEHFLVDFIGADKTNTSRWDKEKVIAKVLPYLLEVKAFGIKTVFDCTPAFLGRDVELLKLLAKRSGLHIMTNTGYYGAMYNKYLPQWAHTETAEQLADRWIIEFKNGIDDTKVKPGFIKIGVDSGKTLTDIHRKLVKAAGLTHLATGLTICSHTGPAHIAFEEIEILKNMGVSSSAFVWVHAQSENNKAEYTRAARLGTWVSLDGIGWGGFPAYADSIDLMKSNGVLGRLLISHDSGWYKPDEPDSNDFKGYTNIFKELMPLLRQKGFTDGDFEQILVKNPAEAFAIRVRKT